MGTPLAVGEGAVRMGSVSRLRPSGVPEAARRRSWRAEAASALASASGRAPAARSSARRREASLCGGVQLVEARPLDRRRLELGRLRQADRRQLDPRRVKLGQASVYIWQLRQAEL